MTNEAGRASRRPRRAAGVRIRRAGPADAACVARIGIDTYREHFADFWTPSGLEAFLARQFDPAQLARELAADAVRYELMVDGDAVVGYAKAIFDQPVPLHAGERGMELQKIYFRAGLTGRGWGTALVEHLAGLARKAREPCIWLQVLEANPGAARFYQRLGFACIGRFAFAGDRGPAQMLVMRRELRGGNGPG